MKQFNPQKNYILLLVVMLCFSVATSLFQGVQENYFAESLFISRSGRGIVEFFRELPGLLLFLILALFYKMPEHRILRVGFFVAIAGIVGFVLVGTQLIPAVFFLTIFSAGQHILMPVRQSYAVHSVEPGKEGSALGLMRSIQSIGRVAGFFIVPLIFLLTANTENGFISTFICVIFFAVGALILSFFLRNEGGHVKRERLYFRKKYKTYYILQNFYGARKQVFLTFGPYVLILKYGASPAVIASLLGICAVISIFSSPLIGKLIDHIGYKKIMVGDTVILFFVCLVYGFAHHLFPENIAFYVICGVFILDSLVSHASMAASVYVKDLSDNREEMTATLTTGISLDHVISIFIALVGGFIWEHVGIELLFVLAAVMAVMNSLIALTIKTGKKIDNNMMQDKTI
jgi:MFS family permease